MHRSSSSVGTPFAIVLVAVLALVPNAASASGEGRASLLPFALGEFGEIATTGEVKASLCLDCGNSVELIDGSGHVLQLSNGTLPAPPYSGLLVVCGGAEPSVVLPQSTEESVLLQKIWRFLDRRYLLIESECVPGEIRSRDGPADDGAAVMILAILCLRQRQCEARRWLDNNFSAAEQDSIFSAPYRELDPEVGREAFLKICLVRGGSAWWHESPDVDGGCTR